MSEAARVHRRLLELAPDLKAGQLTEALTFIDDDVVDHRGGKQGTHRGKAAWRAKWEAMAGGAVSVTVEDTVASGDLSVNRYIVHGPGFAVTGMDMIRVRDGKMVEHWALVDTDAARNQS